MVVRSHKCMLLTKRYIKFQAITDVRNAFIKRWCNYLKMIQLKHIGKLHLLFGMSTNNHCELRFQ